MESLDLLELADWRRQIFDVYRRVRESRAPSDAWQLWKDERDRLFRTHEQSPIPAAKRESFPGADFFPYDPAYRVTGKVHDVPTKRYNIETSGEGTFSFTRFAAVGFRLEGRDLQLELYWLEGYGGGLFLPFKDSTSGRETYGGGRYLLDSVKGADLGGKDGALVLDFNFAYNPSCSYDPQWLCPLSPQENRLDLPVSAGERKP